jgi:hypothetical protein
MVCRCTVHIHSQDEGTAAGLKFTVLNPNGGEGLMVAGGAASVIYAGRWACRSDGSCIGGLIPGLGCSFAVWRAFWLVVVSVVEPVLTGAVDAANTAVHLLRS